MPKEVSVLYTKNIEICPWVSWRSYSVGTSDSRTIISDEKNGCYYLLEKLSSDIWYRLSCGINIPDLHDYAVEQGCQNALEKFLNDLRNDHLILYAFDCMHRLTDLLPSDSVRDKREQYNDLLSDMGKWVFQRGFLWSVHWELTYQCNEKCIHCLNPVYFNERNKNQSVELTTHEALALLDDLVELGVFELTFSGGEPTLRDDFIEILTYARKKGFCVALLTNGIAINDSLISKIANLWPNLVGVSIYSAVPDEHDAITKVPGSFERTIDTLKHFVDYGIQTKISSLLMHNTVKGYKLVTDLGKEIGALTEFDVSVFPMLNGDRAPQKYEISSHEELVLLAASPGSPIEVQGTLDEYEAGKSRFNNLDNPICRAGGLNITLSPSGDITPCLLFPKKVASVRSQSVIQVWKETISTGNWAYSLNILHKNIKMKDLYDCGKWKYCSYCPMCPGKSYLESGNPLLPALSLCKIAKARLHAAELLAEGKTHNDIARLMGLSFF
jgi:AdoMet-dependent heme synthase